MSKITILLAEDNPLDAKIIEWVLNKEVFDKELFKVDNGQDALDFIFQSGAYAEKDLPKVDLLLLDLMLPKLNGHEVLQKIKADPRFSNLHVIVLTHSKDEDDLNKSFEYGAVSFIQKSETYEELHSVLKLFRSYWKDKKGE